MKQKFEITIASVPDRDLPIVELWYQKVQWAEISLQRGKTVVELYNNPSGQAWQFEFNSFLNQILKAQKLVQKKIIS